jgi:hypothetical protein
LAETINGLYKAEVIHRRGPWRSLAAAARGQELVAALEGELDALRQHGIIATTYRSEQLVEWAAGDAPLPVGRDARLVSSDAEIRVSHELNAALGANVDLIRIATNAADAVREADAAVTRCAAAVMLDEGEELAHSYIIHQRLAWVLRDRLLGLRQVWLPGPAGGSPSPIAVSETILAALAIEREQIQGDLPAPAVHQSALWDQYRKALTTDAEAEFVDTPPEPLPVRAHEQPGRVAFTPFDRQEAERLAAREENATRGATPPPAHVQSVIDLARQRGQMPVQGK